MRERERVRAWNGCSGTLAPRVPADAGISMQVRLVVLGVEQFMAVQSHDVEEHTAWVSRVFRVKRQAPRNLARHTIFPKVGAAIATRRVTIHHPHPRESSAPACCCTCAWCTLSSRNQSIWVQPSSYWVVVVAATSLYSSANCQIQPLVWGLWSILEESNPFILYPLRMAQEGCC